MGENRLMCDLYEEHQRLKARISELEEKHWNECGQIAHYDDELKEAKRLLKAAVEGFNLLGNYLDDNCPINVNCIICPLHRDINCKCWKHKAEALALIGEGTNVPASKDGDTNE